MEKINKKHAANASIATDLNSDIAAWFVSGARYARVYADTINQDGRVEDVVTFKCGDAGNTNNPGTWTRTE